MTINVMALVAVSLQILRQSRSWKAQNYKLEMRGRVVCPLLARYSHQVVKTGNSLSVYWSRRTQRIDNAERFVSVKIEELCRTVSNSKGRNLKRRPSNILRNDVTRNFMRRVCFFFF